MSARKSSLPVSDNEKSFLLKDISPLKNLWHGAKKRLVASCSKINAYQDPMDLPSTVKNKSFPGSTVLCEARILGSMISSGSDSSVSICDTMLKVRRLTHVYDEDELLVKCDVSPLLSAIESQFVPDDSKVECVKIVGKEIPRPSAKLGDRSYKLPSKAAAILGADDLLVHQFLHDNNSTAISHALFLENKIPKIYHPDCELIDSASRVQKTKKKSGLGTEVKEKIASLWKQSEFSSIALSGSATTAAGNYNNPAVIYGSGSGSGLQLKDMEKLLRAGKATLEQITNWSHSFESLLHDKFGLAHFHDFLRSEFSDENIEFWIACEEYRTITNNKKLQSRAEKIYNDYVGVQAAREVNLDSKTRQQTEFDIHNPNPHTFDQAQKRIQALMEKDSYQRFLRSELYGTLLRASEEYHLSQLKSAKESSAAANKCTTLSNLGITAQDLSKLTMTTSKLALLPHSTIVTNRSQRDQDQTKIPTKAQPPIREMSLVSTVQPDEPSLPFSKLSLIFTPEDKQK